MNADIHNDLEHKASLLRVILGYELWVWIPIGLITIFNIMYVIAICGNCGSARSAKVNKEVIKYSMYNKLIQLP